MKGQTIKQYELHLFNKKDPIILNQEKGEKLTLVLAGGNPPKFVLVGDRTINVSSIEQIVPKDKWIVKEDGRGIGQRVKETRELTPSEEVIHGRFLRLVTEKNLLQTPNKQQN